MGSRLGTAVLLTILVLACDGPPHRRDAGQSPNVLLVTLDTLRRDRLSVYGYDRPTSPFLEALAARGTRFTSAYTASNVTVPSHASILTGLYPKHHGLLHNDSGILHDDVVTIAEIFRDRGYATFAVSAISFFGAERCGLGQGFEHYDAPGAEELYGSGQRQAETVTRLALERLAAWRESSDGRPFFGWVHFYDPHIPYTPPDAFLERFARPPAPGRALRAAESDDRLANGEIPRTSVIGSIRDPAYYEAAYDAEIAYMDEELRRLFSRMEEWGLSDSTIVAVTADHGEMLGEKGIYYNHASVYEPVAAVPLLLVVPDRRLPATVDAVVETLDLGPTFLDLTGWPAAEAIDGRSLVPLLEGRGRSGELEGYAFTQHSDDLVNAVRDAAGALIAVNGSRIVGERTPGRRSPAEILTYIRAEPVAYYPRSDPFAPLALDAEGGRRAHELLDVLRRWRNLGRPHPEPHGRSPGAKEREQLESLGYL